MDIAEIQANLKAKFGANAVANVRTGGKGSVRRKHKAVHKHSAQDDKKLQSMLKKMQVQPIPNIDEVNLFKDDGTIIHFVAPKVQASIQANTYVVTGEAQDKKLEELIPGIIPQLGLDGIESLKKLAGSFAAASSSTAEDDEDDVPPLGTD